jgi:ABC-type multidrug transport system ATPase subunit
MYQSSTEVFGLFDRICLLSNGNTLFFGETLSCLQVSFCTFYMHSHFSTWLELQYSVGSVLSMAVTLM